MTTLSLAAPPIDALSTTPGPAATSAAELARRGQIRQTAQNFEGSFLTSMFETMFSSVPTDSVFGGGPGEDMWKGFLAEAMAKQTAKRGGIGVSKAVEREMLKLQGLTDGPAATTAPAAVAAPAAPTPPPAPVAVFRPWPIQAGTAA